MPKINVCEDCEKLKQCFDSGVLKKGETRISCSRRVEKITGGSLFSSSERIRERKRKRQEDYDTLTLDTEALDSWKKCAGAVEYLWKFAEADLSVMLEHWEKANIGLDGISVGDFFTDHADAEMADDEKFDCYVVQVIGFIDGYVIARRGGCQPFIIPVGRWPRNPEQARKFIKHDWQFNTDIARSETVVPEIPDGASASEEETRRRNERINIQRLVPLRYLRQGSRFCWQDTMFIKCEEKSDEPEYFKIDQIGQFEEKRWRYLNGMRLVELRDVANLEIGQTFKVVGCFTYQYATTPEIIYVETPRGTGLGYVSEAHDCYSGFLNSGKFVDGELVGSWSLAENAVLKIYQATREASEESPTVADCEEAEETDGLDFPKCNECDCMSCSLSVISCQHCQECIKDCEPVSGCEQRSPSGE